METTSHRAVDSALGYYYQAVYALKLLFDSENSDAFVSIETLDDVYFEDGSKRELHQLKHTVSESTKISIKSESLWRTLKVWCDYLVENNSKDGFFTLSTVAEIDDDSLLQALLEPDSDRHELQEELLKEAERVIQLRKNTKIENEERRKRGDKEEPLPFEKKYKGCIAFKNLSPLKRTYLIANICLNPGVFSILEAKTMVIERIKKTTQPQNHAALASLILAWWDRLAVESLTGERHANIFLSELQEYISRKNAELFNDGFTDDLLDLEIPPITNPHPVHIKQLHIISASESQKVRSFTTEMKARIQRDFWINNSLPSALKLKRYDKLLIDEWSYKFEEIVSVKADLSEDELKSHGRELLDWTHNQAHQQVTPISKTYHNPDFVRGTYQMLSTTRMVGWHCDYQTLISDDDVNG